MASVTFPPEAPARARRNRRAALAGAALVAAAWIVPAAAEPTIEITERFYNVEGGSIGALRAQLRSRGPYSDKAEGHVPARTEATVDFKFASRRTGGTCHIVRIRVTADITYIYPNWTEIDGASVRTGDTWVDYMDNLRIHEEGHGQMVIDAAHEVEELLHSMGSSKDCKALRQRARARGEEILRDMAEAQIAYDEETDGGRTQGAVLSEGTDAEPQIN